MSLATVGDDPGPSTPASPSHLGRHCVMQPANVGSKATSRVLCVVRMLWTAYTVPLAGAGELEYPKSSFGTCCPGGWRTRVETLRVLILRSLMANPLWVAPPPKLL